MSSDNHWWTLAALGLISAASLIGSVSFALGRRLQEALPYMVAVASGTLLATGALDLLPEALALNPNRRLALLLLLGGIAGSFLLERLLTLDFRVARESGRRPIAGSILLSGAIHSFLDGISIAAAFATSTRIGVATTVAVFLHEVPHHIADVGVLIYAGMTRVRAALANLAATFGCALGGILVLYAPAYSSRLVAIMLPVAAANFLYTAMSILMPELQGERNPRRTLMQMLCFVGALALATALSGQE